jgi:SAM-dependent methyltransferase
MTAPDQFYTGLVAEAYAPLRGSPAPPEPYARFVQRYGTPALELGCGHGEPILDLVAAGLDVTGLDSSDDMLDLCRRAASQRGLDVKLVRSTFEDMNIGRRFAAIYFAGPTFQLIVELDNAARALTKIRDHLEPDGRVLIPLFIPAQVKPARLGVWREHIADDGEILAFRVVEQDWRLLDRRVDSATEYRRGPAGEPTELVERVWSLRWYDDGEFEALAAEAGLRIDRTTSSGELGTSFILVR